MIVGSIIILELHPVFDVNFEPAAKLFYPVIDYSGQDIDFEILRNTDSKFFYLYTFKDSKSTSPIFIAH